MQPVSLRLAILFVTFVAYVATPAAASLSPAFDVGSVLPANAISHVKIDSKGAVHVLWTMPPSFGSDAGVWYSKYEPNGTSSLLPRQVRNSSLVQAADMDLDSADFPHIAWTEVSVPGNVTHGSPQADPESTLYYGELNTTNPEGFVPKALNAGVGFVIWPSLAVDGNFTTHLVWTSVESGGKANVYYASLSPNQTLSPATLIAAYNGSLVSYPRPHVALDGFSGLHIAWAESNRLSDGGVMSTVNYAKLDLIAKNLTRQEIGKFGEQIPDLTIAAGSGGSVYVVWQPGGASVEHARVYISRISRDTHVAYLREIDEPSTQSLASSLHLSVSADTQDNLYVVWYTPPAPPVGAKPQLNTTFASISYFKMEFDGSLSQTGNEVVRGPVLAITVSDSGDLYAISKEGIIRVTNPSNLVSTLAIGAVVVIGASSIASAVAVEDSRYRLLRRLTPFAQYLRHSGGADRVSEEEGILRVLLRRPGLRLSEIRNLSGNEKPTLLKLALLERAGYVSSMRTGVSRRFSVNMVQQSLSDETVIAQVPIPSRILHEISRNPGIWEAKLAQGLGLSQQLVHYHLRKLQAARMITAESIGRRKHYRLPSAQRPNHGVI